MKPHNPKVSIVLPTYNGASKYLRQAIESCLNQTCRDIELIIVDDCSTDHTPEVVQSFHDPRIRYVRNEKNQKLPRSLNIGFALTTGEYLTWTSDDNEFLPQALETMLSYLREHPDVDFVYADNLAKYWDTGETKKRNISGPENIGGRNCIGACYLYTRRVYETIGDFNPDYELVEDYEYWFRVSKKFKMHHLPQTLYIYGEHHQSLTGLRMLSILLFDKILKYRYGFISWPQLSHGMGQFLLVLIDHRKSFSLLWHSWIRTLRPISRISFPLGIFFISLSIYVLAKKALDYAIKKLLWPMRKNAVEQKIRRMTAGLKPIPGKINILCAIPGMTIGGSQKVALEIARGLKDHENFCFHLITIKKEGRCIREAFAEVFENIVVVDPARDEKLYNLYFTKIIEALGIDILLISHSLMAYQCLPQLKTRFKNLKIIDILHLERVGAARNEMAWVNPYIDKRVCISHGLRKHMIGKIGTDNGNAARFTTIYNGIDFSRYKDSGAPGGRFKSQFHVPENTKVISYIARFADEKNPLLFVDIARRILETNPEMPLKFVMAGEGYLVPRVKEKIRSYGLEGHILLTGVLDNVQELLADTYLLLVVANNEGIPLTVMEAMAMNVPVVSTVVGATDEVLKDGVHGYLIPQNEDIVEQFTGKVSGLLRDASLHESLSTAPKDKFFNEFSRENMSRQYRDILEELAAGRTDGNE